jgi:hypothetical protein
MRESARRREGTIMRNLRILGGLLAVALCLSFVASPAAVGAGPEAAGLTTQKPAPAPLAFDAELNVMKPFVEDLQVYVASITATTGEAKHSAQTVAKLRAEGERVRISALAAQAQIASAIGRLKAAGMWNSDFDDMALKRMKGCTKLKQDGGARAVLMSAEQQIRQLPQAVAKFGGQLKSTQEFSLGDLLATKAFAHDAALSEFFSKASCTIGLAVSLLPGGQVVGVAVAALGCCSACHISSTPAAPVRPIKK